MDKKKILIVIDMQEDFLYGSLRNEMAISVLGRVSDRVKNFPGEVIFTRDTHEKNYLQTQEGKKLPVEHCIRGSEGWQLVKELNDYAKEHGCRIFDKVTFGSSELAETLRKEDIGEITLIGVCTDICVISNAMLLKAFMPETAIKVEKDCCAGVTKESHENALNAMEACQVEIL